MWQVSSLWTALWITFALRVLDTTVREYYYAVVMTADFEEAKAAFLAEWRADYRKRRTEAGIFQGRVAELAGICQQAVSRIERGTLNPRPATIRKMEAALIAELALQEAKA